MMKKFATRLAAQHRIMRRRCSKAAAKVKNAITSFKRWQEKPRTYGKPGGEPVDCKNCGHQYEGDYCPVCGQAADTPRITAKSMLLRTLDVWGLGNRSMPRNILHLILRPGYMISDYIEGRRQPYFPPIKMLFVLGAFYLLTTTLMQFGGNVTSGKVTLSDSMLQYLGLIDSSPQTNTAKANALVLDSLQIDDEGNILSIEALADSLSKASATMHSNKTKGEKKETLRKIAQHIKKGDINEIFNELMRRTLVPRLFLLSLLYALFTKAFFRRWPRCTALNFTEMFFAQILIFCQMLIVAIVLTLFGTKPEMSAFTLLPWWLQVALLSIDYRQMFGVGTRTALLRTAMLTITVNFVALVVLCIFATIVILVAVL